jgi:hypothetical protein
MTEVEALDIPLNWDVFLTAGIPTVTSDIPAYTEQHERPSYNTQLWRIVDA